MLTAVQAVVTVLGGGVGDWPHGWAPGLGFLCVGFTR